MRSSSTGTRLDVPCIGNTWRSSVSNVMSRTCSSLRSCLTMSRTSDLKRPMLRTTLPLVSTTSVTSTASESADTAVISWRTPLSCSSKSAAVSPFTTDRSVLTDTWTGTTSAVARNVGRGCWTGAACLAAISGAAAMSITSGASRRAFTGSPREADRSGLDRTDSRRADTRATDHPASRSPTSPRPRSLRPRPTGNS